MYAAAMMCIRKEAAHCKQSFNFKLEREARAAHKFVSINLRKTAVDILMLSGDSELNCLSAMLEMIQELAKAEAEKLKNQGPLVVS